MVQVRYSCNLKDFIFTGVNDDVLKNRLSDSLKFCVGMGQDFELRDRRFTSILQQAGSKTRIRLVDEWNPTCTEFRRISIKKKFHNKIPISSKFESGEHFSASPNQGYITTTYGLNISYGEMIAYAGDFYGIPEVPICEGKNIADMKVRFQAAFNTIFRNKKAEYEILAIRRILSIERNSVMTVLGKGDSSIPTVLDPNKTYKEPSDVYKYHGMWFTVMYDTILGGTWVYEKPIVFGRMMKLAVNNPDHFQPHSLEAWRAGHELAVEIAAEGGRLENVEEGLHLLNEAIALELFACHFLTDSFAAGHMRVPRKELHTGVRGYGVGDFLSKMHHDEDGKFGINVCNGYGDSWTAYGDGRFFDERNRANRENTRIAVECCLEQVNIAFSGRYNEDRYNVEQLKRLFPRVGNSKPKKYPFSLSSLNEVIIAFSGCYNEDRYNVEQLKRLLPRVDNSKPNNYPLFSLSSSNEIGRRKNVDDLSDSEVVYNWWGWSTAILLEYYDPKNSKV